MVYRKTIPVKFHPQEIIYNNPFQMYNHTPILYNSKSWILILHANNMSIITPFVIF
jgi:hypothetical protein